MQYCFYFRNLKVWFQHETLTVALKIITNENNGNNVNPFYDIYQVASLIRRYRYLAYTVHKRHNAAIITSRTLLMRPITLSYE